MCLLYKLYSQTKDYRKDSQVRKAENSWPRIITKAFKALIFFNFAFFFIAPKPKLYVECEMSPLSFQESFLFQYCFLTLKEIKIEYKVTF